MFYTTSIIYTYFLNTFIGAPFTVSIGHVTNLSLNVWIVWPVKYISINIKDTCSKVLHKMHTFAVLALTHLSKVQDK